MSILAECTQCGRQYQAPDAMAGKRVRCKHCGGIFQLPAAVDETPDLDALAAMEQSVAGLDASNETRSTPMPTVDGGQADDSEPYLPTPSGRSNVRFAHPYARELDQYLPWTLVVGAVALLGWDIYRREPSGIVWLAIVRTLVALIAFTLFIMPLTLIAIRKAGRALRYQMPVGDRWRTFSSYLPAFAIGMILWLAAGGGVAALALGNLVGVALATLSLWALFRLRAHEILPSSIYAGVGFFVGLAVACGLFFVINLVLVNIVVATDSRDSIPASPISQALAWAPAKGAEVAIKPKPAPTLATAPDKGSEPPTIEPAVPPPPPQTFSSPVVRALDTAPITQQFDNVIRPLTESAFIATLRRDGENQTFELWNTNVWSPRGSATFRNDPGSDNRYVLSPDGNSLARIATFPRLSAQIWSFSENRIARVVELDSKLGNPVLIGFASSSRLLIRWETGGSYTLQVADIISGESICRIETPPFDTEGVTLAVSPDGTLVAVATRQESQPLIIIYDLKSGARVTTAPILSLDARWPVRPTGMAFSFDSAKIAVLFEQSGNGLLLCYQIERGRDRAERLAEHVYPAGPLPGRDVGRFNGNALAWLPSGGGWIIYGQGLFNQRDGQLVATLDVPSVETSRVVAPDIVELVGDKPQGGQRQITLLRLDMAKVSSLVSEN